jgi:hypothetical protein
MLKYQQMVQRVLAQNGIANPIEALCGLLWLLREQHTMSIGFGTSGDFSDGLESLTSEHANTLAESIRNFARVIAAKHMHNAGVEGNAGRTQAAAELEVAASRIQAMCDILTEIIPVWDFEANEAQEAIARSR